LTITFSANLEKVFDKPPIRKKGSRFRRHPFKVGNMTVALSNYCLKENGQFRIFSGKSEVCCYENEVFLWFAKTLLSKTYSTVTPHKAKYTQ
jgi:hypothetical protein